VGSKIVESVVGDWVIPLSEAHLRSILREWARSNVLVERLWRSVKYEDVYLKAYDNVGAARASLAAYFVFYNSTTTDVRTSPMTEARRTWSTSRRCRKHAPAA